MTFAGFDRAALALLADLPEFDASTFAEQRAVLTTGLVKPGTSLIHEVAERLDAGLTVVPRSSVSPLHTDLRFAAPGAARYKDHLLLTTWHGPDKKAAPTLWIRINATSVGFASGTPFAPEIRDRWRRAIAGPRGASLTRSIDALLKAHRKHSVEVAGDQLKKVPPPWDDDHPRAELLRRTAFQIRFRERAPASLVKPSFAEWCAERLRQLLPVHRWLVAELASRGTK